METDIVCPFSTGQLILEATRRILDPELVRTVLGDLGRVLVLSPDPLLRTQKITLTPADGFLLSRVDGSSLAREVLALVPLPADEAERSLFSLLCTGIVDYRQETTSASRAAERTTARHPPPPAPVLPPPPAPASSSLPPVAPGGTAAGEQGERARGTARGVEEIRALILETHARIKRDHFEVMGLERTATGDEVREAYAAFARVLHPDACRDPALADLREKREATFIRLSAAYETLRDPAARAEYERAFEPSKLRSPRVAPVKMDATREGSARIVPPPPSPPSPPKAPTAPPGPLTSAVDTRLMPDRILGVAEALFAEGQYWEAIQQLEPMIPRAEEPTRAQARMLLARAYLKNPMWQKRAEGVLQSLLQDNPRDGAACLALADLYRDANLPTRAGSLYRKVLDIQPGRREAVRALAALDRQEEGAPATSRVAGPLKRR